MIADSTIFNIWVGLNDQDRIDWGPNRFTGKEFKTYMASAPTHAERQHIYQAKIEELVLQTGIYQTISDQISKQYFRLFNRKTFFTTQFPNEAKERYTFESAAIASSIALFDSFVWFLILLGSGIGVAKAVRRPISWLHIFILIILYNLALFVFLHVKTRYVLQFLPFLCIFAGVGFYTMGQFLRNPRAYWNENGFIGTISLTIGSLLSAGLIFIAFYTI